MRMRQEGENVTGAASGDGRVSGREPRHKTWMILSAGLSLALILAVFVNFLQWLLSPQGPERVAADARGMSGLVQAMQEIQPAYKDPETWCCPVC